MKTGTYLFGTAGIIVATACLVAVTWFGTIGTIRARHEQTQSRAEAVLTNQALMLAEQIDRQVLTIDQTLRILIAAWQANPQGFDLNAWQRQVVALHGLTGNIVVTDDNGVVQQSTISDAIGQSVSGQDFFRALADRSETRDQLFLGAPSLSSILRQWHLNAARALHRPDGSFAGTIDVDYRIASITDLLGQTGLGPDSFAALVGLSDGKLRGVAGPATPDPGITIRETPLFAAIGKAAAGTWIGHSPIDAVIRIHAFRRLTDWPLAVIVATDEQTAISPALTWQFQAELFATSLTVLLAAVALLLIRAIRTASRRAQEVARDRAELEAANARMEVARTIATAKAEQLETTLAGMPDGVAIIDGQLCLAEWNHHFPEVTGVPADVLRVGLPMEEILRAQIVNGEFGRVDDPDAEITRRMARLRTAPSGFGQRQRPDGRTIELRRRELPEGGFVTIYTDITDQKRVEEALRDARSAAGAATAAKQGFVTIVAREIRAPLNALSNTLALLSEGPLAPAQQSLLAEARQSGDVLSGLIDDILDLSRIETGGLAIRPSQFDLRMLIDSTIDLVATEAAERGTTFRLSVAPTAPSMLYADPGRLRQVLLHFLWKAVKQGARGEVLLEAQPGRDPSEAVTILVKDRGPVIAEDIRPQLFQAFPGLDATADAILPGPGVGLCLCRELITLMGGSIGFEPWSVGAGEAGNAFWLTLPASALPVRAPSESLVAPRVPPDTLAGRSGGRPPRTRILLVEDIPANQIVTATLLRREGHLVDIAAGGMAAIQALKTEPYDLVFMDVMMPEMGGREAAAAIRALPGPARSVPILALTANMAADDETTIRAAGMDGILGKPVSLAELLAALDTHVWFRHAVAGRNVRVMPSGDAEVINPLLAADRILELRSNLPPQTFVALVEECLVDLDHRMPALRRAVQSGANGAITAHAHAMVGMAAGYGMASLETSLRAILAAARADDRSALGRDAIAKVEFELASVTRVLREMMQDVLA